ncbi:MAG: hypothetical protein ACRETD_14505, partial [Steroidobacteraceae bacterium]
LLDRLDLVGQATIAQFAALGWTVTSQVSDVLTWAMTQGDARADAGTSNHYDVIVANLFLHHFEADPLTRILGAIQARTPRFFACEPRRSWLALAGSHLVGALGVSAVTRADAVLSVHAGFRDGDILNLWPADSPGWILREYPAGLFSHCFYAARSQPERAQCH